MKAKEPVVVAPTPEKIRDEKKKNGADQRVLNKPHAQLCSSPKLKGNHLQTCKEVQEFNIFVIFVDFKDTQDQIAIN